MCYGEAILGFIVLNFSFDVSLEIKSSNFMYALR